VRESGKEQGEEKRETVSRLQKKLQIVTTFLPRTHQEHIPERYRDSDLR
jgi:hypothetical protein